MPSSEGTVKDAFCNWSASRGLKPRHPSQHQQRAQFLPDVSDRVFGGLRVVGARRQDERRPPAVLFSVSTKLVQAWEAGLTVEHASDGMSGGTRVIVTP